MVGGLDTQTDSETGMCGVMMCKAHISLLRACASADVVFLRMQSCLHPFTTLLCHAGRHRLTGGGHPHPLSTTTEGALTAPRHHHPLTTCSGAGTSRHPTCTTVRAVVMEVMMTATMTGGRRPLRLQQQATTARALRLVVADSVAGPHYLHHHTCGTNNRDTHHHRTMGASITTETTCPLGLQVESLLGLRAGHAHPLEAMVVVVVAAVVVVPLARRKAGIVVARGAAATAAVEAAAAVVAAKGATAAVAAAAAAGAEAVGGGGAAAGTGATAEAGKGNAMGVVVVLMVVLLVSGARLRWQLSWHESPR